MPGTAYYKDALHRIAACKKWLMDNGYIIRHSYILWCQGCTDADIGTPTDVYKDKTKNVLLSFLNDANLERCFLIQIGNHRDEPELYVRIQQAQEELADDNEDIVMVSRLFKTFAKKGLMKDEFQYLQEGNNLVGEDAGRHVAEWLG